MHFQYMLSVTGQETNLFSTDEIVITYHSISTKGKNKTIEQGFNYANCTVKEIVDFSETRLENIELM